MPKQLDFSGQAETVTAAATLLDFSALAAPAAVDPQAVAAFRAQHASDVPLPPSLDASLSSGGVPSLRQRAENIAAGAGDAFTASLIRTPNALNLASGGLNSLLGLTDNADADFARAQAVQAQADQYQRSAEQASGGGAIAGNVLGIVPKLVSPAVLAVDALSHGTDLGTRAIDQNVSVPRAEALMLEGNVAGLAQNLLPGNLPGNLLTRALSGAVINAGTQAAEQGVEHVTAPEVVGAPTLKDAGTAAGIGAILSAVLGRGVAKPVGEGERLVADPLPQGLPRGADYSARAEPIRPAPVDLGGNVTVNAQGEAATPQQGAAAFTDALDALRGRTTPPALGEPVVAVDAAGRAATTTDQNAALQPFAQAPLDPLGLTDRQRALIAADPRSAREGAPIGPKALPPPVVTVDRAGQAQTTSQIQQAIARQQQAAADRQALGITPDIQRTQGTRWAKQDQAAREEAARQAQLAELDQAITAKEQANLPARGRNAQPDETVDDALTFLAKKGGLDRRTFVKEGLDPAVARAPENRTRGGASRPLFRAQGTGGMSLDQVAETLWQHGYLPSADNNAALDLVMAGVNHDTPTYSIHRQDQGDLLALQQAKQDAEQAPPADYADVPFSRKSSEQALHANNASGESSASLEAINRVRDEKSAGQQRMLIDRDGSVRPLFGVDSVDTFARQGQVIVQRGIGREPWTVISADPSMSHDLQAGKVNAARGKLDAELRDLQAENAPYAASRKPTDAALKPTDAHASMETSHADQQAIATYNARLSEYIGQPVRFTPAAHVPKPAARALAAFDDAFGSRTIVVHNETPDALDINGVTLRDGVRLVNEDATSPLLTVAAHEMVHQMRKDAPELYAELEAEVRRQGRLDAYGAELNARARSSGENRDVDPRVVAEELTADATGDALSDPDFIERLAQQNPGLFRRLAQRLLDFFASVSQKLRGLGSSQYLRDVEAFRTKLADVLERYAQRQQDGRSDHAASEMALSRKNESPYTDSLEQRRTNAAKQRAEGGSLAEYGVREQREWLGENPPADGVLMLYRAVRHGEKVNPGDYVSNSRAYAKQHLRDNMGGNGEIIAFRGHMDEIFPADGYREFFYLPRSLDAPEPALSRKPDDERSLVAVHNTTGEKILHAERMGGMAVPSIAVTRAEHALTNFGDITLLAHPNLVDPKQGAKAFGADIYSPRYPAVDYKITSAVEKAIERTLEPFGGISGSWIHNGNDAVDSLTRDKSFQRYAADKTGREAVTIPHHVLKEKAQALLREAGAQERLFKGYTANGRSYQPHTLENVVKILKKDLRGGEGFNYGVGSLRAKFTPQFRTMEQIRQAKGRLTSKADFERVKDEVDKQFFGLVDALRPYARNGGDKFGFADTVIDALGEAAKLGVPRALREYGFSDVGSEVQQQVAEFLGQLRTLPTEYFEVKQPRAVGIHEFSAALVPTGTDAKVRKALEQAGLTVTEYPAGDDQARRQAVNDFVHGDSGDALRFSRKPADDQTQTPEFRRWFGDSKVVDAEGKPLVVYHGRHQGLFADPMPDGVSVFSAGQGKRGISAAENSGGSVHADGIWFGGQSEASQYAGVFDPTDAAPREASVYPVYLSIQNPKEMGASEARDVSVQDLEAQGYDGVYLLENGNWVAFRPEQIKSATGNRGTFDPNEPSILFSRKPVYTDEQKAFMRKAGMAEAVDPQSAVRGALEALRQLKPTVDGDAFRQGAIDQFHGLKRAVDEKGGIAPEDNPYLAAEMIQIASTMEAVLRYGAPKLENGVLRVDRSVPGLLDALGPVREAMPEWLGWMVARRAKVLKAQGRENAMSDADIAAGLTLAAGREAPFKEAALGYLKLKNAILDLAEQAGVIDPEARKAWDHAEYVPFYRAMDTGAGGPGTRQGLANQSSGIRTLKGGESPLKDPLDNIIANFTRLIDSSLKNRAMLLAVDQLGAPYFRKAALEMKAETVPLDQVKKHLREQGVDAATIASMPPGALKGVARLLAVKAPEGDDVVRVMRGGKAEYYHVDDPLLLRALTAFNESGTPTWMKPLVWAKQLLTAGATGTPDFLLRNALRDTGEATVTSKDSFMPVVDTVRGAIDSLRESELAQDLMMAGAAFHGGLFHTGNNEDTAKAIRRALRKGGLDDSAIKRYVGTLINPKRLWDVYRALAEATEMGSRVSLARKRLAAGAPMIEAAHEAKDFLNFQRRGDSQFMVGFSKVIPFLNARVQGADRLYRVGTTKGRRGKVAARLAVMALLSTLLYWWNDREHKDAYDEIPDWDKDANWHIAPGTDYHVRIPKPFELGLVGGTVPERMYGALKHQLTQGRDGDRGDQTWDAFMRGMGQALGLNPIPQGAMPLVEDFANKDFYFGSPIESMGDRYKAPSDRYGPTTSLPMRAAAKGMAKLVGEDHTISPKRLEHLWKGYTAGMGQYLLDGADWVMRTAENAPKTPAWALRDFPLVGAVATGGGPPRTTRYVDEFYALAEEAQMRSGQIKDALHAGDTGRAAKLEKQWGWLIGNRVPSRRAKEGFMHDGLRQINRVRNDLSEISKDNARIYADRAMSSEAKRRALDANLTKRNTMVRQLVRKLRLKQNEASR